MFSISSEMLRKVEDIVVQHLDIDRQDISKFILADWHEAEDHQLWLDSATPEDIADWVICCNHDDWIVEI